MSTPNPQLPQDPIPMRRVNVYVPHDVTFNLDKMQQVTKSVLTRLGCPQCHSGRILDFRAIENFVVNGKSLEVSDLHGPF